MPSWKTRVSLFLAMLAWGDGERSIYVILVAQIIHIKDLKNIKNVKRCRDGMPKSMQTR